MNVEIPASCGHDPVTLDGHSKDFGTNGFAQLLVGKAKTGRVGPKRKKMTVVPMLCSAGGVSWPNLVLLYDKDQQLFGAVDLIGERDPQEHLDVQKIRIKKDEARLTLVGYDGCCFTKTLRKAGLSWDNDSFSWWATGALTIDFAHRRSNTELGGPGIIESVEDAGIYLRPAPRAFKKFIERRWKRYDRQSLCDDTTIYVDRYSHKGAALGAETGCGGARFVWARSKGRWRAVLGYQDGPYCYGLTKLQRRALKVLGQSCYDRHFKRHKLGNWPRSGM